MLLKDFKQIMEIFEEHSSAGPTVSEDGSDFVTVVSVGAESNQTVETETSTFDDRSAYVTVLKIGEEEDPQNQIEAVLVYRLPGERLGFGLKFEGGTKAAEFVERLFIQSCAPDSPASRVRSSWGTLKEGDEVLEIDSIPVKTMTRIDCVRCLKDSNVVIKLLIKHRGVKESDSDSNSAEKNRSTEDLPLVVSAEKKRTPPPPPPVPPRKVPRKLLKETPVVIAPKGFDDSNSDTPPLPPARHNPSDPILNLNKPQRQSPRNSLKSLPRQSPEVSKRDRRPSDGSSGPPDAEVYLDLFSQGSSYSLSESDDTGSSISTVVDKLSSFPTTSNSSFSGSLPSTPTAIRRHLDLSNLTPFDPDDFDEFVATANYFGTTPNGNNSEEDLINNDVSRKTKKSVDNAALRPPASFQDAPLSYGNEDVRTIEASIKIIEERHSRTLNSEETIMEKTENDKTPPPPPPRTKYSTEKNNNNYIIKSSTEYSNSADTNINLPRLVDFVPKSNKNSPTREISEPIQLITLFLENEKRVACDNSSTNELKEEDELDENCNSDHVTADVEPKNWTENDEFYTLNWSPSSHLATIGEDEEEGTQEGAIQG